jgi:hypothetical protein
MMQITAPEQGDWGAVTGGSYHVFQTSKKYNSPALFP